MTNSGCHSVKWLSTAHPCAVCSGITMMSDICFMWGFPPCVFRFIISRIQPKSEGLLFFFHLASIYLTFGDKGELISILQKMDSSNVTFLWLKTVRSRRISFAWYTLKHDFQVSNKEDTEDFILSDLNTTPFPNNTGMVRQSIWTQKVILWHFVLSNQCTHRNRIKGFSWSYLQIK